MIHRVPAKGGFTESANITGAGFGAKEESWHITFEEEVKFEVGEWIEFDYDLMTCRLCAELNGVRVSRTLDGEWSEDDGKTKEG
jgi:hypothetical protein